MKTFTKTKKCYVFDFDDVLVKTLALIYVKKEDAIIQKLSSREYTTHKLNEGEYYDFCEFHDPTFIESASEHIMFNTLININNAIKNGTSSSSVFILTARETKVKLAIHSYLDLRGITCVPMENIIIVGDNKDMSTADSKKIELERLLDQQYDITFFDDDIRNIEIANSIPGVKTRHVEDDDI
jgi:hypothetical protein